MMADFPTALLPKNTILYLTSQSFVDSSNIIADYFIIKTSQLQYNEVYEMITLGCSLQDFRQRNQMDYLQELEADFDSEFESLE